MCPSSFQLMQKYLAREFTGKKKIVPEVKPAVQVAERALPLRFSQLKRAGVNFLDTVPLGAQERSHLKRKVLQAKNAQEIEEILVNLRKPFANSEQNKK